MTKPVITYFPARGRAEIFRLVLVAAGVEWEENTVGGDDLAKLKASGTLPFGQLPVYEDENIRLAQSITIARYLARKYGFFGKTIEVFQSFF